MYVRGQLRDLVAELLERSDVGVFPSGICRTHVRMLGDQSDGDEAALRRRGHPIALREAPGVAVQRPADEEALAHLAAQLGDRV